MPIMCVYRSPDITPEIYEASRDIIGWRQSPPVGAISHSISFDKDGAFSVDTWESRADFDRYQADRLAPAFAKLGAALPTPEILEIHTYASGEPADKYRVP